MLNRSYEPLTVCNVKKALILIVLGKAELVENNNTKTVRSVRAEFPWPSVIRLNTYIRVPYKKIILTRKNILKRDGHKCSYCGRGDVTLSIDHILPRSRGGEDTWENLTAACNKCNNIKGDRTPEEAEMKLKSRPYAPNHILYIKNAVNRLDNNWKPYLFQS